MVRHLVWLLVVLAISVSYFKVNGQISRPKVIVDTDTGVDDAFALAMLLAADKRQEIEIVGITTVLGNTGVRNVSRNVLKILQTADRLDIPVFEGAAFSLELTNNNDSYFGYDGFGDIEYANPPGDDILQPTPAVLGLLELSKIHQGEINLLIMGPCTNYALGVRTDPQFPSRLSSLWVLGGSMIGRGNMQPGVEFNFWVDPLAAFITFSPPVHTADLIQLIPLETTLEAATTIDWRINVLGTVPGAMMDLLNAIEEKFWSRSDKWECSDMVLAACFLQKTLILQTRPSFIGVEVHGMRLAGATFVDYAEPSGNAANVDAIQAVDLEAFKSVILDYLDETRFINATRIYSDVVQ